MTDLKPDPTGGIANCTNFALRKASRAVTQMYDQALAPSGLKVTQLPILALTGRHGPIPIARLADELVMDRTTLSRNLKPLERQGWLTVTAGADQRERLVTLTEAGQAALDTALPLWRAAQKKIHDALGGDTWERLMEDLMKVVTATPSP